jgi:hypothetical protein
VPDFATPSRPTTDDRPDITLPNGHVLTPRKRFAKELKVHPRSLARGNHETVYIGGVAYLDRDAALLDIAGKLARRNEPPTRRRNQPLKRPPIGTAEATK